MGVWLCAQQTYIWGSAAGHAVDKTIHCRRLILKSASEQVPIDSISNCVGRVQRMNRKQQMLFRS